MENLNREIHLLTNRKRQLEAGNWFVMLFTFGFKSNKQKIGVLEKEIESKLSLKKRIDSVLVSTHEGNQYKSEQQVTSNTRTSCNLIDCVFIEESASYPSNWEEIREAILRRDQFTCQEEDADCSGPLHVHHILPLSRGGGNDPSNLITLCKYHHSLKHEHMQG